MSKRRQFSSRWFRVYDEAVDDPKIQMLSDRLHRFWFNCMCLACKHGGYLPPVPEIAWRLRKTESTVIEMLGELQDRNLLDQESDGTIPHNWTGRQFDSDVSTDRVRRFRERNKPDTETPNETFHETDTKRPGNVPETHQNRTDTETETEQKQSRPFAFHNWRSDETYAPFVAAWREVAALTGKPLIDDDFSEAYFRWKGMDFEQKLLAVKTTKEHISLGVWTERSEPQFIPLPSKYLEKEYKRPVVAPKPRDSPSRALSVTERARAIWEKQQQEKPHAQPGN